MIIHWEEFNIDPATVESNLLEVPTVAIDEMVGMGKDLVLDAQLAASLPPDPSSLKIDLDDDENAIVAAGATTAKPPHSFNLLLSFFFPFGRTFIIL